jgi:hypothetical protein
VEQWGVEPERSTHGFRSSPTAQVLLALLVLEVAVFAVSTLPGVRSSAGFDPLIDGWLQGAGHITAAALAVLRPLTSVPGARPPRDLTQLVDMSTRPLAEMRRTAVSRSADTAVREISVR